MTLGLGIDTGGTYTDSVIADMGTGEVICRSKSLTTHDDLSRGIGESIKGLGFSGKISMLSLSTTLATNSVVEGKSCRVGLILIGKEPRHTVDTEMKIIVPGEFDLRGNIVHELDTDYAESQLLSMKGKVDSVAIAGYLSVRYPEHENVIRDMAERILGVPTVCAHDLTSKLGYEERVNTAAMNAGLIPVIMDLIDAVKRSLRELGMDAPMMIVKGDGSVMSVSEAIRRPVETIMSGPASSITSVMRMAGVKDGIVVDMGGTTTDVGIISGGYVHTLDSGAVIGGYRTRVRAADVSTFGIGGDSGIYVTDGDILISNIRSIPLCIASADPSYLDILSEMKDSGCTECKGKGLMRIGLTPTDILEAEGTYRVYPSELSEFAVHRHASELSMTDDEFISLAKKKIAEKIASSISSHLSRICSEKESFYEHSVSSTDEGMISVSGSVPIIGIGAPAGAWLPDASDILGKELILPDNYEVANAVGAISSSVTEYVELAVRASPNDFSENPECRVYTGEDSFFFKNKEAAMEFALSEGRRLAVERAERSCAKDIAVDSKVDEIYMEIASRGQKLFRGADVIIRATGRPDISGF